MNFLLFEKAPPNLKKQVTPLVWSLAENP